MEKTTTSFSLRQDVVAALRKKAEDEQRTVSATLERLIAPILLAENCKGIPSYPEISDPNEKVEILKTENGIPQCPHKDVIALYHLILPMLPRVRVWNAKRQKNLAARWKENPDLEWWEGYFKHVLDSDFLTGRNGSRKTTWSCNLEWLVNPSNLTKVFEGNYDNKD